MLKLDKFLICTLQACDDNKLYNWNILELYGPGFLPILAYGGNTYLTIAMSKFYFLALKVYVSSRDKAEGDSCCLEGNTKPYSHAALTSFSPSYFSNILNVCLYNGTRQNQI